MKIGIDIERGKRKIGGLVPLWSTILGGKEGHFGMKEQEKAVEFSSFG